MSEELQLTYHIAEILSSESQAIALAAFNLDKRQGQCLNQLPVFGEVTCGRYDVSTSDGKGIEVSTRQVQLTFDFVNAYILRGSRYSEALQDPSVDLSIKKSKNNSNEKENKSGYSGKIFFKLPNALRDMIGAEAQAGISEGRSGKTEETKIDFMQNNPGIYFIKPYKNNSILIGHEEYGGFSEDGVLEGSYPKSLDVPLLVLIPDNKLNPVDLTIITSISKYNMLIKQKGYGEIQIINDSGINGKIYNQLDGDGKKVFMKHVDSLRDIMARDSVFAAVKNNQKQMLDVMSSTLPASEAIIVLKTYRYSFERHDDKENHDDKYY